MTAARSASKRKMRRKRRIVEWRGLGSGSGTGMKLPFGRPKWDYQGDKARESGRTTMTIAAVLRDKGSVIETISGDASVHDAVRRLGEKRIGALPVLEEGRIAGIMSERDVIYCLRDHGPDVLDWPVSRVMSSPAITADSQTEVLAALALMTQKRIRHLPVVDRGEIRGIVSIGDLVKHRMERIEAEADAMRAYIQSA
jgi:CBS domain-containing protein